jgi:hypothetical protein
MIALESYSCQSQFKMISSVELLDALFQSPLTKIVAVLCNELLAVLHVVLCKGS